MIPQKELDTATQAVDFLDKCVGQAALNRTEHFQAQQAYQFIKDLLIRLGSPPVPESPSESEGPNEVDESEGEED